MSGLRHRVGWDASAAAVARPTGVANAITRLAAALAARPDVELCQYLRVSRWRRRALLRGPVGGRRRWLTPLGVAGRGLSVFHGPDTRVPRRCGVPRVATIHDFSALQDQGFCRGSFRETRARHYREAAERAALIVVYTEAVAQEVCDRLSWSRERLAVVPLAPVLPALDAAERAAARSAAPSPYILVLGELSRRKNTASALAAFAEARGRSSCLRSFDMVVVGAPGYGAEEALVRLDDPGVRALGYVSAERVPALVAGAEALFFPSRYEGFGLPVVDALRLGVPVIAGDIPALREVGGDAVCYVHPEDLDAQASALVRLAEDSAFGEGLRIRGPERAGLFSWERSASALAAAYARACEP